jgi:hypothetical protein
VAQDQSARCGVRRARSTPQAARPVDVGLRGGRLVTSSPPVEARCRRSRRVWGAGGCRWTWTLPAWPMVTSLPTRACPAIVVATPPMARSCSARSTSRANASRKPVVTNAAACALASSQARVSSATSGGSAPRRGWSTSASSAVRAGLSGLASSRCRASVASWSPLTSTRSPPSCGQAPPSLPRRPCRRRPRGLLGHQPRGGQGEGRRVHDPSGVAGAMTGLSYHSRSQDGTAMETKIAS